MYIVGRLLKKIVFVLEEILRRRTKREGGYEE
jgi:hypothetical protein